MEMLVVASRKHGNGSCFRRKIPEVPVEFCSSPSGGFKGFNCSAAAAVFKSGAGIIPTPPPKNTCSDFHRDSRSPFARSEPPKQRKRSSPIRIRAKFDHTGANFTNELSNPEIWAGPAYSNSPPPSSLPIPKFSLWQKRSISLELPMSSDLTGLEHFSKSAPASPAWVASARGSNSFHDTISATENLRRILHLDIADD